jgi:hypothetical protein
VATHSDTTSETIRNILRLRRAEELLDPESREELAATREFLEDSLGPTVRQADAARLLGISQPSLLRWLDLGEIASVRTPTGRREIPVSELVDLLEELEEVKAEGGQRPLARVLRERRRRANEEIDLDRILPRRRDRGHRTAELQSLAYHRVVAERLDDRLVSDARRRLRRWRTNNRVHPRWLDEWDRVLKMPRSRIAKALSADTPHARQLRQTSPFAGALSEQERRRLNEAVEQRR